MISEENLKVVLKPYSIGLENVLKTTIFLKDINHFTQVNQVYSTYFKDEFSARSCVEISHLPKDAQVEIEAIAYCNEYRRKRKSGITAFLTNYAVAEKQQLPQQKLLKALALTHLVTFFIKSYTGTLSAMCGCGVAAGIGASGGVAYLLGGNKEQIMGALWNMVGSISGLICDGAKEGCAYKLALASGWAVQSALLSLKGAIIHNIDGIVDPDFRQLFKNLGYLCDPGMIATDQVILDVMINKKISL